MKTMTFFLVSSAFFCLLAGCGGPNYAFDPLPAPSWTQATTEVQPTHIRATGATRVTTQLAFDTDLAKRNALQQIATTIQAQVVGRTMVWSTQIEHDDGGRAEEVVSQDIEVRTRLPVEGAEVMGTYRDETSQTAYVQVQVDPRKWARRVDTRLVSAFETLEKSLASAGKEMERGAVFNSLKHLAEARRIGQESAVNITVIDILSPRTGRGKRAAELKEEINAIHRHLRGKIGFEVNVQGRDAESRELFHRQLTGFIQKAGFQLAGNLPGGKVLIQAEAAHQSGGSQRVGRRLEHKCSARGGLRVIGVDGQVIPELSFELLGDEYEERAPDEAQACEAAERLAADTLSAQFRSRYRRLTSVR